MPALPSTSPLDTFATQLARDIASNTTAGNTTGPYLQVVCAFPVSGQYGPGARYLYYALIFACVSARKYEWLRNACLAAALIFPVVAALHAIALAALHLDTAVDMDIYGAFQLCAIGILAAPVTVKNSKTYLYDPGRNTIFVWTILVLAGLASLTVEFFRSQTWDCVHDELGNPVSPLLSQFNYNTTCGLVCDTNNGPFSVMRMGSANNIYVIPAPSALKFDTALLLGAACCVLAVLSLITMWNKILEINWTARFGTKNKQEDDVNREIEGTNGATPGIMKEVNDKIRIYLTAVEVPFYYTAVLAIVILGERNFFSDQVRYQTEPMASIGQWAPIAGTAIAVLGSLYVLLAQGGVKSNPPIAHCQHDCDCHKQEGPGTEVTRSLHSDIDPDDTNEKGRTRTFSQDSTTLVRNTTIATQATTEPDHDQRRRSSGTVGNGKNGKTTDAGRSKVAKAFTEFSNFFGSASENQFDLSDFKKGRATNYPEVPGEQFRSAKLYETRTRYNQFEEVEPEGHGRSRTPSRAPSVRSGMAGHGEGSGYANGNGNGHGSTGASRTGSLPTTAETLPGFGAAIRKTRADTYPVNAARPSLDHISSTQSAPAAGPSMRGRRDTLTVPRPVHVRHCRTASSPTAMMGGGVLVGSPPETPGTPVTPGTPGSPTIVVSDGEMTPGIHAPVFGEEP